jgi:hypothetical protein
MATSKEMFLAMIAGDIESTCRSGVCGIEVRKGGGTSFSEASGNFQPLSHRIRLYAGGRVLVVIFPNLHIGTTFPFPRLGSQAFHKFKNTPHSFLRLLLR